MRLNSGMFILDFPALVSFTPVSFGVCLGPAAEEFSRGAEWEWLQGGSSWWSCCTHTAGSMSLALGISYICMLLCYITWTVHRCSLLLHTHTHTHTRLTAVCPGLPGWADTRKVKPIWILLKQETVSDSGISWAICKSASRSRQITMPVPHHSVFLQAGCPSCRPTNSVKAL